MVVVDTSVVAAIVFGEDDAVSLVDGMLRDDAELVMSAATLVEASIVVAARKGEAGLTRLSELLSHLGVTTREVDAEQAARAVRAWRRFGKGNHPAALNLGDCFSYALAKSLDAPLTFKGHDFEQTDLRAALEG
ncbi:MAG: type II toxin-antitoxin system VapC family toxin [Mobilicoccus sp.]|nr:type II toxin-antitoxin system VapC family toxin [Mobilicoccus sp.]